MTFVWIGFGLSALVLFIMAFSNLFKGRMGPAAIFGIAGIVVAAIAGAARYA